VEPPVLAAKEDGDPPFRCADAVAQFAGRVKRHSHWGANRLAHLPGRCNYDAAPGKDILDGTDLSVFQDILRVEGTAFGFLAKRAGVDQHHPGETEILHHPCGESHVSLI